MQDTGPRTSSKVCLPFQAENVVVKTHGEPREEDGLRNHVDLVLMLDIVDLEAGTVVAGAIQGLSCLPPYHSLGSALCSQGSPWSLNLAP